MGPGLRDVELKRRCAAGAEGPVNSRPGEMMRFIATVLVEDEVALQLVARTQPSGVRI